MIGTALSSGLRWLARRRALHGRTGWTLAGIGDPHAGPFTAGSEDTALWSSLGGNAKRVMDSFEDGSKKTCIYGQ